MTVDLERAREAWERWVGLFMIRHGGQAPWDATEGVNLAEESFRAGFDVGRRTDTQFKVYWQEHERAEAAESRVRALEARLAALTGALKRIEAARVDLTRVAAFNEAFYRVKNIAMEALAAEPADGEKE